ncbi:MAG: hypothetical protein WCK61_01225 [Candidatus Omnitrophota bacterium]
MGKIKGQLEYEKFKESKPLTRKEAILAQCYVCNGEDEGGEDCLGLSCPLYRFHPYKQKGTVAPRKSILRAESGSFMASQGKEMAGVGVSSLVVAI